MSTTLRRAPAGAHYGLRDWLIQRLSALVLGGFVLAVLVLLVRAGHLDYDSWAGVFAGDPMKLAAVLAFAALAWHAWIGVRDIWMDYIKPAGLRLALHAFTVLWLLYCLAWAVRVLWSI